MSTAELKKLLRRGEKSVLGPKDYLHSGSTLLNLACTDKVDQGFAKGTYILFVGDTSSGKTWLSHTCFAEACLNKEFKDYRLIFDNAENGALMDIEFYFGKETAERLEPPAQDTDGDPLYSRTIEEFYYNVDDAFEEGKPFIYVLDSVDALTSVPEEKKFDEHKKANRKGKESEAKGDYGADKAKTSARNLRKVVGDLERSGSILIVLNQTRDNIGGGMFDPSKTRSGGWALEFYAHIVMWSSVGGHLTKEVNGKKRELGIRSRVKIKKNRLTGKVRQVEIPIYHSHGIDDVGSCVDFLIDEGFWKKNKAGFVEIADMGPTVKLRREAIIKWVEDEELVSDLLILVQKCWDDVEAKCRVERKPKYR